MGQINPTVRLYVVTVDGSAVTTELRPPDSFEKRWDSSTFRTVPVFYWSGLLLTAPISFPQWLLHHHGEMGDRENAECPVGESSSEHINSVTVWCHNKPMHQGQSVISVRASAQHVSMLTDVFFVFLVLQKHVMTSERWLDRVVSASFSHTERLKNIWVGLTKFSKYLK